MLRKSPASYACAGSFKKADFSWGSFKVRRKRLSVNFQSTRFFPGLVS